jgi:hypothetical protein
MESFVIIRIEGIDLAAESAHKKLDFNNPSFIICFVHLFLLKEKIGKRK